MAERAINFLQLAGWGSPGGAEFSTKFHGPMQVSADKCLLTVTVKGAVKTDGWVAERLGGITRDRYDQTTGRTVKDGMLRVGQKFQVHASYVRLMG